MTDTPAFTLNTGLDPVRLNIDADLAHVVDQAVAATEPVEVGDHGLMVRDRTGQIAQIVDVREHEDFPRTRSHVEKLVGTVSFCAYFGRHDPAPGDGAASGIYVHDVYGRGVEMLTRDSTVAVAWFDDFDTTDGPDLDPTARRHGAQLVLRPTASARRWGNALQSKLSQEQFLDLVVDGITEIAEPAGADLRDLASNLHAIRTAEVTSVQRTGGNGQIVLAENVKLTAGPGNAVEFPESMRLTFAPFASMASTVVLTVRIAPEVRQDHVVFTLSAPDLDDQLARIVGDDVVGDIIERTSVTPLWIP